MAEQGGQGGLFVTDGDMHIEEHENVNVNDNTDVQMDIPHAVYESYCFVKNPPFYTGDTVDDPFFLGPTEQIGGGIANHTPSRYSLRRNIPLTPKAQQCDAARKAAQHRAETIPASPTSQTEFLDIIKTFDAETIASLDCANSSPFLETPSPSAPAPVSPLGGEIDDDGRDKIQPELWPKSLFKEFLDAGEFQPLVIPPVPVTSTSTLTSTLTKPPGPLTSPSTLTSTSTSTATSTLTSNLTPTSTSTSQASISTSAPLDVERHPDSTNLHWSSTPTSASHLSFMPTSSPKASPSSSQGRSLNREQAEKCSEAVTAIFKKFEKETGMPAECFRKYFVNQQKTIRQQTPWNIYQKYFSRFRQQELDRCGLNDGDARDCWPSFIATFGNEAEDFLRSSLELDQVLSQTETVQQRDRTFRKFCQKVDKISKEGTFHHFQLVTIVVGECINEDASLAHISASPGLQNFFKDRLKLEDNVIMGLAKCEAFHVVAQQVTANYDAGTIIQELEGAKEASKAPSEPPVLEELPDDGDPINGCKVRLISLFKTIGIDFGRRLPWTTIPKHLISSSHVLEGWPVDVLFPCETIKAEKARKVNGTEGSQGIKDLGHKNARILQNALITGAIKLKKINNPESVSNNTIPIISTALPESDDSPNISARDLYANGKIHHRAGRVTSLASTRVKRRKTTIITKAPEREVISVSSDSTSDTVPSSRPVVEIVSDSDNDHPTSELHKRHKISQSATAEDAYDTSDEEYLHSHGDESESNIVRSPVKTRRQMKVKQKGKGKKEKVSGPTIGYLAGSSFSSNKDPVRATSTTFRSTRAGTTTSKTAPTTTDVKASSTTDTRALKTSFSTAAAKLKAVASKPTNTSSTSTTSAATAASTSTTPPATVAVVPAVAPTAPTIVPTAPTVVPAAFAIPAAPTAAPTAPAASAVPTAGPTASTVGPAMPTVAPTASAVPTATSAIPTAPTMPTVLTAPAVSTAGPTASTAGPTILPTTAPTTPTAPTVPTAGHTTSTVGLTMPTAPTALTVPSVPTAGPTMPTAAPPAIDRSHSRSHSHASRRPDHTYAAPDFPAPDTMPAPHLDDPYNVSYNSKVYDPYHPRHHPAYPDYPDYPYDSSLPYDPARGYSNRHHLVHPPFPRGSHGRMPMRGRYHAGHEYAQHLGMHHRSYAPSHLGAHPIHGPSHAPVYPSLHDHSIPGSSHAPVYAPPFNEHHEGPTGSSHTPTDGQYWDEEELVEEREDPAAAMEG
ncbi:hypothetical protein C0992_011983 [Termitomyces sp. T32_za158]|nr:hypothetical protein C0992_011983 [Termitomyces sp. T32_za158]